MLLTTLTMMMMMMAMTGGVCRRKGEAAPAPRRDSVTAA